MTLRADQHVIAELITPNTKVMDIGCGEGELLSYLEQEKQVSPHGIEVDSPRVSAALAKGLSVVQGDADSDLQYYPDNAFDYVILGMTLQVMRRPKEVLEQSLRIGERVILVIPNFGHIRNRWYLGSRGRMPVTKELSYQWYETPNIHFCTIKDMVALAKELGCEIETRIYLTKDGKPHPFRGNGFLKANLMGEQGIFVLRKV